MTKEERIKYRRMARDVKLAEGLRAKNDDLRRTNTELRKAVTHQFARGSAEMLAGVMAAMPDDEVCLWISSRLLSARTRKPPFGLSGEVEDAMTPEVIAMLARCGIDSLGPTDIVNIIREDRGQRS